MEVRTVQIALARKDFLSFDRAESFEGLCHIKTLPYLSVVQAVEGEYEIALGSGEKRRTGTGGFFIAPADVSQTIVHHIDPKSRRIFCRWVFMHILLNGSVPLERAYDLPAVIPPERATELSGIFDRLFLTDDPFEEHACFYEIAALISKVSTPILQSPDSLAASLSFIKENYREKLSVSRLAREENLSTSRFHALFKEQLGTSPAAYLNSYRLSKAAELLTDTEVSVSLVGEMVGINDSVYFGKMFKKAYQMSPGQYRRTYGKRDSAAEKLNG